jgi:hypothetical protein
MSEQTVRSLTIPTLHMILNECKEFYEEALLATSKDPYSGWPLEYGSWEAFTDSYEYCFQLLRKIAQMEDKQQYVIGDKDHISYMFQIVSHVLYSCDNVVVDRG